MPVNRQGPKTGLAPSVRSGSIVSAKDLLDFFGKRHCKALPA